MTEKVLFLNPQTCGIYKSGGSRFKTDPATGKRTDEVDNQMLEHVMAWKSGKAAPGQAHAPLSHVYKEQVLVPTFYDPRYATGIQELLKQYKLKGITLGQLLDDGTLVERRGHGSPSNDQRKGTVPYIKVSDIRALRVNINPTNMVPLTVARRIWRGSDSKLQAWDVISPNRASANIGEFAILLPGEERVLLTKEMFVFRVAKTNGWDPFYLLWALSLRVVREQWRGVTLMQTNREDCGDRYREIVLPQPPSTVWARKVSNHFRECFQAIAAAKGTFNEAINSDEFEYIPTVLSDLEGEDTHAEEGDAPAGGDDRSEE